MSTLKVLMVEDSEEDALLILRELRKGEWELDVHRVENGIELADAFTTRDWDIALCDYWMHGFDGLKALAMIRAKGLEIPVILISGTIGEELAVQAMKAGANDYLMKDNLKRLVPVVERELREYQRKQIQESALRESEEKFRQAQKMEIVGRLAGSIAHDFNNILAIILGYLDLLEERQQYTQVGAQELKSIEKAALQAVTLVKQLLSISRKHTAEPRAMDLNSVILENQPILQMMMGENIIWKFQPQTDLAPAYADPHRVEQVLLNLASNAHDAMKQSGTLTVRTYNSVFDHSDLRPREMAKPGRYVTLEVRDTGTGIESYILRNIFEPFFTTKNPGQGTGLGLSTVKAIVEEALGVIRVESQVGEGSVFKVHFPIALEDHLTIAEEKTTSKILGKGQRILILEDNSELRQLIALVLKLNGYDCAEASDFWEAQQQIAKNPYFDLLLSDLSVPGITKEEAIHSLPLLKPGLKILFMSGYAPDSAMRQGLELRLFQFLPKPFTPTQLLKAMNSSLELG